MEPRGIEREDDDDTRFTPSLIAILISLQRTDT